MLSPHRANDFMDNHNARMKILIAEMINLANLGSDADVDGILQSLKRHEVRVQAT
jgi:hypothetical protein